MLSGRGLFFADLCTVIGILIYLPVVPASSNSDLNREYIYTWTTVKRMNMRTQGVPFKRKAGAKKGGPGCTPGRVPTNISKEPGCVDENPPGSRKRRSAK